MADVDNGHPNDVTSFLLSLRLLPLATPLRTKGVMNKAQLYLLSGEDLNELRSPLKLLEKKRFDERFRPLVEEMGKIQKEKKCGNDEEIIKNCGQRGFILYFHFRNRINAK